MSRGLWSITLDNQYGVAVSASCTRPFAPVLMFAAPSCTAVARAPLMSPPPPADYTADQNGDIVDPFCGTSSAVSIFQQYMPLLASVPSYPASPT